MELTKEYFDTIVKALATKEDLKSLATKEDLHREVRDAVDQLARMVSAGFDDIRERIDVRDRVTKVEAKLEKIGEALHISL